MKNIILIGMPSAGKSTVGVILAKKLGMSFVDTDVLIQAEQGSLLQDIINNQGVGSFLKIEENILTTISLENTVISTGGSAVYSNRAMEHLSRNGIVIYLHIDINTMIRRLHNLKTRGIVLGKGQTISDIYEERKPLYQKYADISVDCSNLTIDETVDEISKRID